MIPVAHSLSVIFLHPAMATLFAFGGIALGVALRKIALHRLSLLAAAAMGTPDISPNCHARPRSLAER